MCPVRSSVRRRKNSWSGASGQTKAERGETAHIHSSGGYLRVWNGKGCGVKWLGHQGHPGTSKTPTYTSTMRAGLRVADEVFIATALLHRETPDRNDFTML